MMCNRLKALAQRKRVRKKEREAAARLRSRVAMGMENTAIDLPEEEGIFSLKTIKVNFLMNRMHITRSCNEWYPTFPLTGTERQSHDLTCDPTTSRAYRMSA